MTKLNLSPCQEIARKEFNDFLEGDDQFFILTGGPGRGKSFMTELLLKDVYSILGNIAVHATATTNKAAKVVSDFTQDEAGTIHSLLGLRIRNNAKTGKQDLIRTPDAKIIQNAFIMIDEISMIDNTLLVKLAEGTINCRFLLVGDKDQLAPVNQSKPPIFSQGYRQCELITPMRFDGAIGVLSEQLKETVRTGVFKPIVANDKDIIHLSGEEFRNVVEDKFHEDINVDQYKIICWKNDTVRAYNDYIRLRHHEEKHFVVDELVVTNQPILKEGKVMYSTDEYATVVEVLADTQYDVDGHWYKLERGCAVFQATDQAQVKSRLKQLAQDAKGGGSWHQYFLAKEFFADLRAVHACTSYKSQGSSYHAVFIDLDDIGECRQWESVARQLYVSITRAKRKVYLYGSLPHKYNNFAHKVT